MVDHPSDEDEDLEALLQDVAEALHAKRVEVESLASELRDACELQDASL